MASLGQMCTPLEEMELVLSTATWWQHIYIARAIIVGGQLNRTFFELEGHIQNVQKVIYATLNRSVKDHEIRKEVPVLLIQCHFY